MGLEALKFVERAEMGIAVIEPDDEPDRNLIILQVIQKRAAVGRVIKRPTNSMWIPLPTTKMKHES